MNGMHHLPTFFTESCLPVLWGKIPIDFAFQYHHDSSLNKKLVHLQFVADYPRLPAKQQTNSEHIKTKPNPRRGLIRRRALIGINLD